MAYSRLNHRATFYMPRMVCMVVTGDYQEDQICQKHPDDNDTHLAQEAVGEAVGE